MPDLTAADTAEYQVTLVTGPDQTETRVFVAAYVVADDAKMPGFLAFKDHQHKTVALVSAGPVLTVERLDRGEVEPAEPPKTIVHNYPIPGAAGVTSTVHFPPGSWSVNTS
jgi:hypothetical protein